MYFCPNKTLAMKTLLSILITLLIALGMSAEAQVVDRTKNRAQRKANNRVDRKIDQGIDRGLDAVEGLFKRKDKKKKSSKNRSSDAEGTEGIERDDYDDEMTEEEALEHMMSAFGSGGNVEIPAEYAFDHHVDMVMTQYNKRGKEESRQNMRMFFSDSKAVIGVEVKVEGTAATSVIDMEAMQMVVLTNMGTSKMAMVVDMNAAMLAAEDDDMENYENPVFKKTGRTKKLLGYHCEEYIAEEDGERVEFWITRDEFLDVYQAFTALEVANQSTTQTDPMSAHPGGMTMEMISTDEGGERMTMVVTAVNRGQGKVIKTAGYQTMKMPGSGR